MKSLIFDSVVVLPTAIATIEWGQSEAYDIAYEFWSEKQRNADAYEQALTYLELDGEDTTEGRAALAEVRARPEPDPNDYRGVVITLVTGRKFVIKGTTPLAVEQEVLRALG